MLTCRPHEEQMYSQQEEIISKTIITQKQFALDCLNYSYLNKYKLQKIFTPSSSSILKIKNLPCTMNGNQLRKVTQIEYGDKKFYIEDVYVISGVSSDESSSKRESRNDGSSSINLQNSSFDEDNRTLSKKCCLFRKLKGKNSQKKRNTKNVAKNFCKAFLNHLKSQRKPLHQTQKQAHKQKQKLQTCISQVKTLTGHKKYYNNNVIWKIISSNVCKEFFRVFLEIHARNWIQNSKMGYKEVHLQAIEIYLNLYEKMTFLEGDQEDDDDREEGDQIQDGDSDEELDK